MARPTDSNEQLLCSFCGKSQRQVKKLIAGPGVYICDECIDLCNEIIDEELTAPPSFDLENLPKPREIYDVLDEYVVGQEEAKRTLSVAVYNHYKRVQMMQSEDADIELQKSNILLLGPTGCGKTLLAQTLARILNVPFAIADATALTEAGYVGEDVENILLKLIQAADYDVKKAETGIIYIDEVDKIARKADNPSITRDVSGEGVQQALLKILEGTTASVPPQGGRKHPHQEFLSIDTTNVLFICGGAFANLDKVIERRIGHKGVGFGATIESKVERDKGEIFEQCLPEDLVNYGLIPEFIGRLPVMSAVHQLTRDDLITILTEPRNALVKQFQRFFQFDGIELVFSDDALVSVADKALERETGARGLRSIIEEILLEVQFELPSRRDVKKCVVTKETVEKRPSRRRSSPRPSPDEGDGDAPAAPSRPRADALTGTRGAGLRRPACASASQRPPSRRATDPTPTVFDVTPTTAQVTALVAAAGRRRAPTTSSGGPTTPTARAAIRSRSASSTGPTTVGGTLTGLLPATTYFVRVEVAGAGDADRQPRRRRSRRRPTRNAPRPAGSPTRRARSWTRADRGDHAARLRRTPSRARPSCSARTSGEITVKQAATDEYATLEAGTPGARRQHGRRDRRAPCASSRRRRTTDPGRRAARRDVRGPPGEGRRPASPSSS